MKLLYPKVSNMIMSDTLCKIVKADDIPLMTEFGFVPLQPDDLINCHLTLFPKKWLDRARDTYFYGEKIRAYYVDRKELDDAGYVVLFVDDMYILIGPGDEPMKPIPIKCIRDAVLEN
jgi:hypothetical protein